MIGFVTAVTDLPRRTVRGGQEPKRWLKMLSSKCSKNWGGRHLRLEDFAQTLVHTDFAHKYTLHLDTKMKPKTKVAYRRRKATWRGEERLKGR